MYEAYVSACEWMRVSLCMCIMCMCAMHTCLPFCKVIHIHSFYFLLSMVTHPLFTRHIPCMASPFLHQKLLGLHYNFKTTQTPLQGQKLCEAQLLQIQIIHATIQRLCEISSICDSQRLNSQVLRASAHRECINLWLKKRINLWLKSASMCDIKVHRFVTFNACLQSQIICASMRQRRTSALRGTNSFRWPDQRLWEEARASPQGK